MPNGRFLGRMGTKKMITTTKMAAATSCSSICSSARAVVPPPKCPLSVVQPPSQIGRIDNQKIGSGPGGGLVQRRHIGLGWFENWAQKQDMSLPAVAKGYYVLFPQIPDETPQNNRFLASIANNERWPPLKSATQKEFYEGTIRLLMDYGATVWEMQELLAEDPNFEPTFANTLLPLYAEEYDVRYASATLLLKMLTDWRQEELGDGGGKETPLLEQHSAGSGGRGEVVVEQLKGLALPLPPEQWEESCVVDTFRLHFLRENELMGKFSRRAEITQAILKIYREDLAKREQQKAGGIPRALDPSVGGPLEHWDARLVEQLCVRLKQTGVDRLKTDKKLAEVLPSWEKGVQLWLIEYFNNIHVTNRDNRFIVAHRSDLRSAPQHVLRELATNIDDPERGPWLAQMTPRHVYPLLRYCSRRGIRQGCWEKWVRKAGFDELHKNNSNTIEDLRFILQGRAKDLGFASPAALSVSTMMAGNPKTVRDFIDLLRSRMSLALVDRFPQWRAYGEAHEDTGTTLAPFDLFYLCRREAEHHHKVDFLELARHFPFWPTFGRIVDLVSRILGLEFTDVSGDDPSIERCHPSVRVYAVRDKTSGDNLGRLYLDPFRRREKQHLVTMYGSGWTTMLARVENRVRGLDKLVYMIGSAEVPTARGQPATLHFEQLEQLLFHFGRAVQMLVSRAPYYDLALPEGPYTDFDARDMFPDFLRFFVTRPNMLREMSGGGGGLTPDQAQSAAQALARAKLWESYRALFLADLDFTMHSMEDCRKKFWHDLYRKLHKDYFPFPLAKGDVQPVSFVPFLRHYPLVGVYYRKLWSEMLALDIHETFDREANVRATGERLKRMILEHGAGELQGYLYNRFQGRDPAVGAICDFYDPNPQEVVLPLEGDESGAFEKEGVERSSSSAL